MIHSPILYALTLMTIYIHIPKYRTSQRQHVWLPFGKYLIRTATMDETQNWRFSWFCKSLQVSFQILPWNRPQRLPSQSPLTRNSQASFSNIQRHTNIRVIQWRWVTQACLVLVSSAPLYSQSAGFWSQPWVLGVLTAGIYAFSKSSKGWVLEIFRWRTNERNLTT